LGLSVTACRGISSTATDLTTPLGLSVTACRGISSTATDLTTPLGLSVTACEILGGGDGSRGTAREGKGGNNNSDDLHLLVSSLNEGGLNEGGLNDCGLNEGGLGWRLFLRWKADEEN